MFDSSGESFFLSASARAFWPASVRGNSRAITGKTKWSHVSFFDTQQLESAALEKDLPCLGQWAGEVYSHPPPGR